MFWPVTEIWRVCPGTDANVNVADSAGVFGSNMMRLPPAMRLAPPASTAPERSSGTALAGDPAISSPTPTVRTAPIYFIIASSFAN